MMMKNDGGKGQRREKTVNNSKDGMTRMGPKSGPFVGKDFGAG
jgi:hypothetical protein